MKSAVPFTPRETQILQLLIECFHFIQTRDNLALAPGAKELCSDHSDTGGGLIFGFLSWHTKS